MNLCYTIRLLCSHLNFGSLILCFCTRSRVLASLDYYGLRKMRHPKQLAAPFQITFSVFILAVEIPVPANTFPEVTFVVFVVS